MPQIFEFKCDQCDFGLPRGWGGVIYVKDNSGNKVICPHPAEVSTLARVLKIDEKYTLAWILRAYDKIPEAERKLIEDRVGFDSNCLCLDCLNQFRKDVEKEKKNCPGCSSENIKTEKEVIGQLCPKCKRGIIKTIDTGIIS